MPVQNLFPFFLACFLLTKLPFLVIVLPLVLPIAYLFAIRPTERHIANLEVKYGTSNHAEESTEMTTPGTNVNAENGGDHTSGAGAETGEEAPELPNGGMTYLAIVNGVNGAPAVTDEPVETIAEAPLVNDMQDELNDEDARILEQIRAGTYDSSAEAGFPEQFMRFRVIHTNNILRRPWNR